LFQIVKLINLANTYLYNRLYLVYEFKKLFHKQIHLEVLTMKTIETLLLNCIDSEIQENDFSGILKIQDYKSFDYVDKFEWLYNKYIIESGQNYSIKEWFQGLPVQNLPHWNDDIEELGLNSGTYWDDLANTLLTVIGLY